MFENVIGNIETKKILKNDITNNQIAHAYLFLGKKGIGKKMISEEFAKEILKTNNINSSANYSYTSKLEGKKEITIEQIRDNVINNILIAPTENDYKVTVIDEAEFLNISAQNALLKSLEEPPKHTVIIIISNKEDVILETINSRVKKVNFSKLSREEIKEYIEKKQFDECDDDIIDYADGSIGKLEELLDTENYEIFLKAKKSVSLIDTSELDVIESLTEISIKKTNFLDYMEYLLYKKGHIGKINEVLEARMRIKQNGNEDIIKTSLGIKLAK